MSEEGTRSNGRWIVTLTAALLALLAIAPANGAAAKPKLSVADATVSESSGTATVGVELSKKARRKVKATFTTSDGTARAGSDYETVSGTVRIHAGRRRAAAEIPLLTDALDEDSETFAVELIDVLRARTGDRRAEVAIEDDDAPPRLSIPAASIVEGDSATQAGSIAVSLSAPSAKPVEVGYSMAGGTASAGSDFVPAAGSLLIVPGDTTAAIPVTIAGNTLDENDESFTVNLTGPVNATIGDGSSSITIADDDPAPVVSITTTSVAEGTSGTYAREITAVLSGPSDKQIGVSWATASNTATSAVDFEAASGQLSFAPGEAEQTFEVTIVGDYGDEPDEQFAISLTSPVNVSVPSSSQVVSITDDDAACVSPDSAASASDLGDVPGDTNAASIQQLESISPCGDSDWFRFTLTEQNDNPVDLRAAITLTAAPNDSPSQGDLDLCVRLTAAATPVCSTASGTNERVDVCVDDVFGGGDNATDFLIEVDGFGLAANTYTLQITGNTVASAAPTLSDC